MATTDVVPIARARRRTVGDDGSAPIDVAGLEAELRRQLDGEVRFDGGSRALYATDGSNYRQVPIGVVIPRTVDDVVAAVDHARAAGLRVAVQGTGHGAGSTPLDGALLINMARMTGVEVDARAQIARVAGGTLWRDVVDAAVGHGLTALHGSA